MVETTLNYLAEMPERPYYYLSTPPEGESWRNTSGDRRKVGVDDARALQPKPTLDHQGFALAPLATAASDLYDEAAVLGTYYREVEQLVGRFAGAEKVVAFDHNLRSSEKSDDRDDLSKDPVRFVHCDYTEGSGPQRVRDLLPAEEAEARLEKRFAVINVWKPIHGPVLQAPLAFCDASTVADSDLIGTDLRYADRTGEVYSYKFNPAHRWYYYSRMQENEALLLKCFDSDPQRARFPAHTAFDDPTSPADAPPRESIEVRTMAFFAG